jgi:peptidoglycan/xylan/chitin deacetylase (PgdA/CDA1 family)
MTFDDGPDPSVTPALLDLLDELGVKATFFCIGRNVLEHPDLARRILQRGHEIGNHSFGHPWWLNFLRAGTMLNEMRHAQDAIASVTGEPPRFYRPPRGLTNIHVAKALRGIPLRVVGWDARALDQYARESDVVVRRILRSARDGSIVLLHDGGTRPGTLLKAVAAIVPALRQRGYSIVPLDRLLEDPAEGSCPGGEGSI